MATLPELARTFNRATERARGQTVCHACGQPLSGGAKYPVRTAIADYLVAREERASFDAIRPRLAHVLDWLDAIQQPDMSCEELDAERIVQFRKWSAAQPVVEGLSTLRSAIDRLAPLRQACARLLWLSISHITGRIPYTRLGLPRCRLCSVMQWRDEKRTGSYILARRTFSGFSRLAWRHGLGQMLRMMFLQIRSTHSGILALLWQKCAGMACDTASAVRAMIRR